MERTTYFDQLTSLAAHHHQRSALQVSSVDIHEAMRDELAGLRRQLRRQARGPPLEMLYHDGSRLLHLPLLCHQEVQSLRPWESAKVSNLNHLHCVVDEVGELLLALQKDIKVVHHFFFVGVKDDGTAINEALRWDANVFRPRKEAVSIVGHHRVLWDFLVKWMVRIYGDRIDIPFSLFGHD